MSDTFTLGTQLIVSIALSFVIISVTWRAATGRLVRNQTAGIRIPSTMASEKAWQVGHRAALPVMWLLAPVAAVADVAAVGGVAAMLTMWLWVAASVLVVIIAGVIAGRAARRVTD